MPILSVDEVRTGTHARGLHSIASATGVATVARILGRRESRQLARAGKQRLLWLSRRAPHHPVPAAPRPAQGHR